MENVVLYFVFPHVICVLLKKTKTGTMKAFFSSLSLNFAREDHEWNIAC